MKRLFWLCLTFAGSAFALETDNYLSWHQNLADSSEDLNRHIQSEIEGVLKTAKKYTSCKKITFQIANRFKSGVQGEVFVNWSTKNLSNKIYPTTDHYLEESIYRETPIVLLKHATLAPNMQVGGVYFGADKLSHFASTGRRYFTEYLKQIKNGKSVEEAERAAIHVGLSDESGILGIWASGVYSYGDLEANFQGLTFYRKFCLDEKDTYLEKTKGRWTLVKVPDLRDYVNPYWDETFNLSYSEPRTWEVASKVLIEEYCPLRENDLVLKRFDFYRKIARKSRSMKYIDELQASGSKLTPIPSETRSFEKLCQR